MSQFDWPINQKNEIMEKPQNKCFILKDRGPSLWPIYIGERRTTFAKAYGIKVRCYWELFGGTCQELGNSLLSCPHPSQNKKKKSLMESEQWTGPLSTPNTT
jgi:hypothetical protein